MTQISSQISYTSVYSVIQCTTHHDFLCVLKAELSWVHHQCLVFSHAPGKTQGENKQEGINQTPSVIKKNPLFIFWESCYLKLRNNHMILHSNLIRTETNNHSFWEHYVHEIVQDTSYTSNHTISLFLFSSL